MEPPPNFKSIQDNVSSSLVNITKSVNQLAAEDLPFHRSLDRNVAQMLDGVNSRLLGLVGTIVQSSAFTPNSNAPSFRSVDELDDNWSGLVDVIDTLLEKADTSLDEYTGMIKRKPAVLSKNEEKPAVRPQSRHFPAKVFQTQNIPKPQLLFNHPPSNDESEIFKPLLTSKPHALVPLEESLVMNGHGPNPQQYRHPYEVEIAQYQFPASILQHCDPIPYMPYENTTATYVDTPEAMLSMLDELKTAKEIAVDLEHHDARSYIGLVSLMQISTRNKDWIVDTLVPWRQDLQILNEVFADPGILKVFHGSYMDIIWLQRDLGLYVVGLFDTAVAARALKYSHASLAHLLKKFVDFDADKQYQRADWRIRPLPEEMFQYARSDTHFLLYVYDNLRNELIQRSQDTAPHEDLMGTVLQNSKEESLKLYGVITYKDTLEMSRTPSKLSPEQVSVWKGVHKWRDTVARQEDESLNYVLPRWALTNIAKELPTDTFSLLRISHPPSEVVKRRANELLAVISSARLNRDEGAPKTQSRSPRHAEGRKNAELIVKTNGEIRAQNSNFWGQAVGSSAWSAMLPSSSADQQLSLAIPLPPLSAEVFRQAQDVAASTEEAPMAEPAARAEHEYIKGRKAMSDEQSDVFIIKQLGAGRKRKMDGAGSLLPAEVEQPPLDSDDHDAVVPGAGEGRPRRKGLGKEVKGESKSPDAPRPGGSEGNDEPFDYAKAKSVLHASPNGKEGRRGVDNRSFDPYSKSGDAPKGLRRSKKEKAGKSFTFKT
ncbi:MAG: exosome nuclease subunit [Trizodia sp. TS-e1964]|nr:MAG: exosome nuclease subunit [Trizodia sp. TS-e1964]